MAHGPCIHHWQIETPSGAPEVKAHCYRCGMNRTFPTVSSTADALPNWKEGMTMGGHGTTRGPAHRRRPTASHRAIASPVDN